MATEKAFSLTEDVGVRATRNNGDYQPRIMGPTIVRDGMTVGFGVSGEKSGVMSLLYSLNGETKALPSLLARILIEQCEEAAQAFDATARGETFRAHVAARKVARETEAA